MLRLQSLEIAKSLLALEQAAHAAAGTSFNLDSPKQLQDVLFGKLALPVKRRTATGQPSTAEDVLEELALEFELPRLILGRSEEHTSELQSRLHLVCRLLLEKKN